MNREITSFEKALIGDYEIKDIYTNIARCKEIAELVYRVKYMPDLQLIEIDEFVLDNPN